MTETRAVCFCGRPLGPEAPGRHGERLELRCACGRLYDFEFRENGWTRASDAITPEGRQPLAGFSAELKMSGDCRRYYFFHSVAGRRIPVHILFSPSEQRAEVKTGDMKALAIAPVESVVEARRRWIERFDALPGRTGPRRRNLLPAGPRRSPRV